MSKELKHEFHDNHWKQIVYEWQWYVINNGQAFQLRNDKDHFFTEDEINKRAGCGLYAVFKYEQTKKMRQ